VKEIRQLAEGRRKLEGNFKYHNYMPIKKLCSTANLPVKSTKDHTYL
jgi:hypothetical protein